MHISKKFSYLSQEKYCATALFVACQAGHAQIVKTLIENGADVNHQTQVGILHVCVLMHLYNGSVSSGW